MNPIPIVYVLAGMVVVPAAFVFFIWCIVRCGALADARAQKDK